MFLSFCDIDLSLIQTARHLTSDEPRQTVYTTSSGKDVVITPKQTLLFNLLNTSPNFVIPVTARPIESLNKVESVLNFNSFKICNYGVFIYDSKDELVVEFTHQLRSKVSQYQHTLKEVIKYLHLTNVNSKAIQHDHFLYYIEGQCSVPCDIDRVEALEKRFKDISVYFNGKSFAIFPKSLRPKEDAVRYLKKQLTTVNPALTTVGLGDSTSDLFFMNECDYMLIPTKDNVQITKELF